MKKYVLEYSINGLYGLRRYSNSLKKLEKIAKKYRRKHEVFEYTIYKILKWS